MYNVFVATKETQGERKSDFCYALEGEIVVPVFECDSDKGNPDGPCGCRRSLAGIHTRKATTTFRVVEMFGSPGNSQADVREGYTKTGFSIESFVSYYEEFLVLVNQAQQFQVGTIVEKRGTIFQARNIF